MKDERARWRDLSDDQWSLVKQLRTLPKWGVGAPLWVRAGFRCEYCHADLLGDALTYRLSQGDHILPQSIFRELAQDPNNFVQACGLCNQLKRNWAPPESVTWQFTGCKSLTAAQRRELIELCRGELDARRRSLQLEIEEVRETVFRGSATQAEQASSSPDE